MDFNEHYIRARSLFHTLDLGAYLAICTYRDLYVLKHGWSDIN